jgi:hypothetical protein
MLDPDDVLDARDGKAQTSLREIIKHGEESLPLMLHTASGNGINVVKNIVRCGEIALLCSFNFVRHWFSPGLLKFRSRRRLGRRLEELRQSLHAFGAGPSFPATVERFPEANFAHFAQCAILSDGFGVQLLCNPICRDDANDGHDNLVNGSACPDRTKNKPR